MKAHGIRANNEALKNMLNTIHDSINPFDKEFKNCGLRDVSRGKTEAKNLVLHVDEIGHDIRLTFIKKCSENSTRFKRPVSKTQVDIFLMEVAKRNVCAKHSKVVGTCMVKDLMEAFWELHYNKKLIRLNF